MVAGVVERLPSPTVRTVFLGLVATGAAMVVAVSIIGLLGRFFWVFDLASHYRLQYAGLLALAAVAAAAARSVAVAVPVGLACLVHLIPLVPLVVDSTQPPGPGPELRVVQFNARIGNPAVEEAAAWLNEQEADLLVIQEADQGWARVLDDRLVGVRRLDSGRSTVREDSFGMVVYAADGLDVPVVEVADVTTDWSVPIYLLEVDLDRPDGSTLQVIAIHTLPPISSGHAETADRQFEWAADTVNDHDGPRLIVGDLNATRWSAPFRGLVDRTGLRDSADGFGLRGTWPSALAVTGMIGIDHVLVSDEIRVDDRRVGPDLGSDHRPVVADLTVTIPSPGP